MSTRAVIGNWRPAVAISPADTPKCRSRVLRRRDAPKSPLPTEKANPISSQGRLSRNLRPNFAHTDPGGLPDILFGDGPLVVPIQHVHHAHLFQCDRRKLADGDVDDG